MAESWHNRGLNALLYTARVGENIYRRYELEQEGMRAPAVNLLSLVQSAVLLAKVSIQLLRGGAYLGGWVGEPTD